MTQTIESQGERLIPTRKFFLDRFWIWLTGLIIWLIGAAVLFLIEPVRTNVAAIWAAPATLAAVQADLAEMKSQVTTDITAVKDQVSTDVADLRADINAVAGDNRVIRQTPGLSYVTEPVHVGEPVVLNLVASRTELGARCVLTSGQSLFTEAGGVITPGSEVRPGRQMSEEQTRMRIRLTPPDSLRPGRIELYIALEYDCDGRRVFDRTDVVTYQLLAAG